MNRLIEVCQKEISNWINGYTSNEIAVFGIIVAIVIAIITICHVSKPKLTYMMTVSKISFPNSMKNLKNLFQIKYNKKSISNLSIAKVVLTNEGKKTAKSFSNPIKITSINHPIICTMIDDDETTKNLNISITEDINKRFIDINIDYLNENDKVVLNMVFDTDETPKLIFSTRCLGCSSIKKVQGPKRLRLVCNCFICLSLLLMFLLYSVTVSLRKQTDLLEADLTVAKEKIINKYHELYNRYEDDEKNIIDIKGKIKTPLDILEAYTTCESKLKYYIDYAKRHVSEKIKEVDIETTKPTQLPK